MGLPISFFFHLSPKIEEINEIRRVNYTHANYYDLRNYQANLKYYLNELLYLTFQFHNVLLKSITNPFIFSKATDVEKW